MVLGAKAAAREHQNNRVDALQLAEPPSGFGVVGQLVVGKGPAGQDVGAHEVAPLLWWVVTGCWACSFRLDRCAPAVGRDGRTGDVAGTWRNQESDHLGDLLGLRGSTHQR